MGVNKGPLRKTTQRRTVLLYLAALRAVLAVAAIAAAKFLYNDHFLWLVLMRPTKEVFLFGGFLARRQQEPSLLLQVALAGIPISVAGVWLFYYLGRCFSREIEGGDLPGLAGKLLPARKVRSLQTVLNSKGTKLVLISRLAVFPSTAVGAAAGSSNVRSRDYLPADFLGALVSIGQVMGIGYLLGDLFDPDDPVISWTLTVLAVIATFALLYLLGRYLRREAKDPKSSDGPANSA